jgi:hypothetical protein
MSKELAETVGTKKIAWLLAILAAFAVFATVGSQWRASAATVPDTSSVHQALSPGTDGLTSPPGETTITGMVLRTASDLTNQVAGITVAIKELSSPGHISGSVNSYVNGSYALPASLTMSVGTLSSRSFGTTTTAAHLAGGVSNPWDTRSSTAYVTSGGSSGDGGTAQTAIPVDWSVIYKTSDASVSGSWKNYHDNTGVGVRITMTIVAVYDKHGNIDSASPWLYSQGNVLCATNSGCITLNKSAPSGLLAKYGDVSFVRSSIGTTNSDFNTSTNSTVDRSTRSANTADSSVSSYVFVAFVGLVIVAYFIVKSNPATVTWLRGGYGGRRGASSGTRSMSTNEDARGVHGSEWNTLRRAWAKVADIIAANRNDPPDINGRE